VRESVLFQLNRSSSYEFAPLEPHFSDRRIAKDNALQPNALELSVPPVNRGDLDTVIALELDRTAAAVDIVR